MFYKSLIGKNELFKKNLDIHIMALQLAYHKLQMYLIKSEM